MTLLVPFDGSPLAEAALSRATQFGEMLDEPVLAVSVIPDKNPIYARKQGWLDAGEPFDVDAVVTRLREQVADQAPEASFQHTLVPRNAQPGTVAKVLRRVARESEATLVFVGSENAGRLVTSLSSVGGNVASDPTYDVVIVRHTISAPLGEDSDRATNAARRD